MLASVRRHGELRFGPEVLQGKQFTFSDESEANEFRGFYDTVAFYEYNPTADNAEKLVNHPYMERFYEKPAEVSKQLLLDYILKQGHHFYP